MILQKMSENINELNWAEWQQVSKRQTETSCNANFVKRKDDEQQWFKINVIRRNIYHAEMK